MQLLVINHTYGIADIQIQKLQKPEFLTIFTHEKVVTNCFVTKHFVAPRIPQPLNLRMLLTTTPHPISVTPVALSKSSV